MYTITHKFLQIFKVKLLINLTENDYKLLSCPKAGIKLDKIIKYEENFSTNIVDPSIEIFFNTSDVIKLGKEVKFEKTVDSWKFK